MPHPTSRRLPFLLLGMLFAVRLAAAPMATDAEIRKILVDRIDAQQKGVGIVVGVIEPSGARRIVAYGTTDRTSKRPVNGDTVFEIGSVTKVFTGLLLADAVQRGEVSLDDPVAKFLPAGTKVPEKDGKQITLLDLATHTSALPRLPSNLAPKDPANPYADYTAKELYRFLGSYILPRKIGDEYDYSNLGLGLLGHALALRAGVDYDTLVRTRIAEPLGMKSTGIKLSDAMQKWLAAGHDPSGEPVPLWDIPVLAGAGALRSTANDLLTFLAANLRRTTTPLNPAIAATLKTRRPMERAGQEVALGWLVSAGSGGREIAWHNGGTGGYRSFIGFDATNRTGVVVLSNMSTPAGVDDIGRHLLDPVEPLQKSPPPRTEIAVDPKVLDHYVGIYELSSTFALLITREGNQLYSQATGQQKAQLFPESDRKFFFKVVDAQITFHPGEDGRAMALTLHQNGNHTARRVETHAAAPKTRTKIALDPKFFDRYKGRYQLGPAFMINITREGDRLFLQVTAQPKFELFAESEKDFFVDTVDAQVTFETNSTGYATKLILYQNGTKHTANRIE